MSPPSHVKVQSSPDANGVSSAQFPASTVWPPATELGASHESSAQAASAAAAAVPLPVSSPQVTVTRPPLAVPYPALQLNCIAVAPWSIVPVSPSMLSKAPSNAHVSRWHSPAPLHSTVEAPAESSSQVIVPLFDPYVP